MTVREAFNRYPEEAKIIGRLLAGYADLEIQLMHCAHVVRADLDTVLKTMFRTRGESARVEVADAFGRQAYKKWSLDKEFSMAVGAVKKCLKIRNQYAHCIWYDDYSGQLAFTNLEEIAETNDLLHDMSALTIMHVDVPLLRKQDEYFIFTDKFLAWVQFEGRTRSGELKMNVVPRPKQLQPPPMHNP